MTHELMSHNRLQTDVAVNPQSDVLQQNSFLSHQNARNSELQHNQEQLFPKSSSADKSHELRPGISRGNPQSFAISDNAHPNSCAQTQPAQESYQAPIQSGACNIAQSKNQSNPTSPSVSGNKYQNEGIGSSMPAPLKVNLEQLSGFDLSGVKVHYNSPKPSELNALAYTQRENIYIGPGQEQHLPHEGWHVVQQLQGRVNPTSHYRGVPINSDERLEREADVMGRKADRIRASGIQRRPSATTGRTIDNNNTKNQTKIQRKSIRSHSPNSSGLLGYEMTSVKGIKQLSPLQLQANETTSISEDTTGLAEQDEAKREEYERLGSGRGSGDLSDSATVQRTAAHRGEGELPSQLKANNVAQKNGCTPENTALGNNALSHVRRIRESWRSHVDYDAWVTNRNNYLSVRMYIFAKVYYGLWVSWETIDFTATVDVTCQQTEGRCEIAANERGGSVWSLTHSPTSGAIAINTDRRGGGTQMALTVRVGGAVGANSSVSAGVGPYSAGVSFPDASISHKMSMGAFIYSCR